MAKPSDISPWALTVAGGIGFAYLINFARLAFAHHWLLDADGHPLATDFLSFWSAGRLALAGRAAEAYDWPAMHAFQGALMHHAVDGFLGWAYPPLFFVIAGLLALLPYSVALLTWIGASATLFLISIARIARDRDAALLAVAAPASLACTTAGQNGFLTAALMAGALLQLEGRPLLAGFLLGLLTYKPQFGLLFPLALIVGGHWRAFASAIISTGAILLISWLAVPESLAAFARHLGGMSNDFLSHGGAGFYKLQSLYGLLRMIGVPDDGAFAAQTILLLATAAFIAWLWRSGRDVSLKCAALCVATLLATPYLFLYDFPILSIAIAFLWRAQPFDRVEMIILLLSQIAIAGFVLVNVPMGLIASMLTLFVAVRRSTGPAIRTTLQVQRA